MRVAFLFPLLLAGSVVAQPSNFVNVTNAPARGLDPVKYINSHLADIGLTNLPVKYDPKGDLGLLFCRIKCGNKVKRDAVWNLFRSLPKYSITSSLTPPEVCVVLVYDPATYGEHHFNIALAANLKDVYTRIAGKVLRVTDDGLLVKTPDHTVLVSEGPHLVDDDSINVDAYFIGEYKFSGNTVRHYTCAAQVAIDHWTPTSEHQATREVERRTTSTQ